MLHSARDEKGKAQEFIASWAFPAFIISILSVMPGSDRASPFEPKARCAFVRQSLPNSDAFILVTRRKCVAS